MKRACSRSGTLLTALLLITLFAVFAGCSGAKQTPAEPSSDAESATTRSGHRPAGDRDLALDHFIQGSVYDLKGDYAKAILEYQDALRYHEDPAIFHALAKDYLLLEKTALAAQMAERAIKEDPGNTAYRETLADVYVSSFEVEKAIAQYERILQIDSNSVNGWYNLARLYQSKKPLRSLDLYRSIIDRFGPQWDVYLQIAEIYSNLGQYDKSAEAMQEMLIIDPGNTQLKMTLADSYSRAGDYDKALRLYDELLELTPQDVGLQSAVAGVYIKQQNYTEAAKHYGFILDQDSVSVESKLRIGEMYFREIAGDSARARADTALVQISIPIFQRIAKLHPKEWRAFWFLGAIGTMIKDDSMAVVSFRKVTELDNQNANAWLSLSQVYFRQNKFEQMAEALEQAVKVLPDDFQINLLLGVAYNRLGRNEDAVHVLETAVTLNPKNIDALSTLALTYDTMKRFQDSDRIYEQAIKLDPKNHLILNNYGYSLADRGIELERALKMAEEAVRQQPENSSYLDTLGWVYFRLGDYQKARQYVSDAVKAGDASAVIQEHLGDIYSKLNQPDKALEYWQKAYEIDSSNQALKEKIDRGQL